MYETPFKITCTRLTPLEALRSVWLLRSHLKENDEEKGNDEDGGHLPNRDLKSIALFAGPFSRDTYTALYFIYENEGCRARFRSWGCRGATVAQSLPSHALTVSIPPDRPFPLSRDPLYLPDSPSSLSASLFLSLCLLISSPAASLSLSLSSHPHGSLAIISPPPICLATPGTAKCLFETHPSRRHFPANGIDAPGPRRGSARNHRLR